MQVFVIPEKDLIVRDPITFNPLPEKGAHVDYNGSAGRYWRRRVKDGSISIIKKVASVKPLQEDSFDRPEDDEEPIQAKRKDQKKGRNK